MTAHLHLKEEKAKSNWFTTEQRKGYGWSKIPGKNAHMRLPKRGKKKSDYGIPGRLKENWTDLS